MKLWQCLQPFFLKQNRIRIYKENNRIDKLASWRSFFYIGVCGCALCAFYAFRILLCLPSIVLLSSRTHCVPHARLSINLQFVCRHYPIRSDLVQIENDTKPGSERENIRAETMTKTTPAVSTHAKTCSEQHHWETSNDIHMNRTYALFIRNITTKVI